MATFTKKKIEEIIDDEGNLIGTEDLPKNSNNNDTEASHTTDYNATVHGQNYKNDFLGRFGFYFYEDNQYEQPPVVVDLMKSLGSEEMAWKIMDIIKPHLEKTLDDLGSPSEMSVTEAKVVEDKLTKKKNDNDIVKKKGKGEIKNKTERVADLLSKLPSAELDKLMKLLEAKRKK